MRHLLNLAQLLIAYPLIMGFLIFMIWCGIHTKTILAGPGFGVIEHPTIGDWVFYYGVAGGGLLLCTIAVVLEIARYVRNARRARTRTLLRIPLLATPFSIALFAAGGCCHLPSPFASPTHNVECMGDSLEITQWALKQKEYQNIADAMVVLINRISTGNDQREIERAFDGYAAISDKLEKGWPGFNDSVHHADLETAVKFSIQLTFERSRNYPANRRLRSLFLRIEPADSADERHLYWKSRDNELE